MLVAVLATALAGLAGLRLLAGGGDPWTAAAAVGVAVAAWVQALRSRRRADALIAVARAFADGRDDLRAELDGTDALAEAGRGLNELGERLREARLRTQREQALLATALDRLAEGVACLDAFDQVVYANPAWRQLAAGGAEVDGRAWYEHVGAAAMVALVDDAHDGIVGDPVQFEHRRRLLEATAAPASGGLVVAVLRDRTVIEAAERQRRELVAAIGHELKTPLTAILGAADSLLDGAIDGDPGQRRAFVASIQRHGDRLASLVGDVLALARLDHGGWRPRSERIALAPLLRVIAEEHAVSAARRGIAMRCTVDDRVVVEVDPELLRQLVGNLVSNAVRYNRDRGEVRIAVRSEPGAVAVEVADTGIGIPDELKAKVFEPFFRVDPARSRATGGTGLGLSIVARIARLIGARVDLASAPSGTTVTVRLPALPGGAGV